MRSPSRLVPRVPATLGAAVVLGGLGLTAAGPASAAPGDIDLIDPPAFAQPDDKALTSTAFDLAFSGNGQRVAYSRYRSCVDPSTAAANETGCRAESHVWAYNLRSGDRTLADALSKSGGPVSSPLLSDNGAVIAWRAGLWGPDADLSFVERAALRAGDIPAPVTGGAYGGDGTHTEYLYDPSLSADGRSLAYRGGPYLGCNNALYRFTSPSAFQPTGLVDREIASSDCVPFGAPILSADGNLVVYAIGGALKAYDATTETTSDVPVSSEITGAPTPIAMSADAKLVLYKAARSTGGFGLYLGDLATGDAKRLAAFPGLTDLFATQRAVAQNGRFVTFSTTADPATGNPNPGGARYAYVWDATTGSATIASRRAASAGGQVFTVAGAPSLSTDGRYLLVAADAPSALPDPTTPAGLRALRIDLLGSSTDTTAPPRPARFGGRTLGSNDLALWWSPTEDTTGGSVTYRVRLRSINGSTAGIAGEYVTTGTSLSVRGLAAGTTYRIAVTAADLEGNRSPATTGTFTTRGTFDATPPVVADTYGSAALGSSSMFLVTGTDLSNVKSVLVDGVPAPKLLSLSPNLVIGFAPVRNNAASAQITLTGPFGSVAAGRFLYGSAYSNVDF